MNTIIVIVHTGTGHLIDLEIPVDITADELISSLHLALHLPGERPKYIRSENPVALICGRTKVEHFGLRNASTIYI